MGNTKSAEGNAPDAEASAASEAAAYPTQTSLAEMGIRCIEAIPGLTQFQPNWKFGSTSRVHKAVLNGKKVAIKQFMADYGSSSYERAVWESKVVKVLSPLCPFLVQYVTCNTIEESPTKNYPYLITELHELGTLREVLDSEEVLSWKFRIKVCTDLAKGMAFLHDHDVAHLDLKAMNCVISSRETTGGISAKIFDFGKSRDFRAEKLAVDTFTPTHMSPEQIAGDSYDETSDVYAFGVVLYEVGSRKMPYDDQPDVQSVFNAVERGKRPKLDENFSPKEFCQLAAKCWAQRKETRPRFSTVTIQLELMQSQGVTAGNIDQLMTVDEFDANFTYQIGQEPSPNKQVSSEENVASTNTPA
eukprot:m.108559 g.108559  ORF g.108559 m.108559 type:complete len:359 (+) comp37314_c0_seq3:164-1240(+)